MNENINLCEILKDCPKGTKFYSSLHGDLLFSYIYLSSSASKITFFKPDSTSMADGTPITVDYYRDGRYYPNQGECTIFPSKVQRDWNKFTAPWLNKESEKFDPHTLKPFDKVLARKDSEDDWHIDFFSCFKLKELPFCLSGLKCDVIPYNDDTKHLVGTMDDVPDFYRYWED